MNMQQHGDVLIKRINDLPECAKKKKRTGDVILAEGEVTGHAHRIANAGAELYEANGVLYLKADETCTLTHEEHKPQTIEPGIYEIGIVREYDYFTDMEKRVAD